MNRFLRLEPPAQYTALHDLAECQRERRPRLELERGDAQRINEPAVCLADVLDTDAQAIRRPHLPRCLRAPAAGAAAGGCGIRTPGAVRRAGTPRRLARADFRHRVD